MCTRVYTTVYPRVYYCIHACTRLRSQYIPSRPLSYVCSSELTPRCSRETLMNLWTYNNGSRSQREKVPQRDYAPALPQRLYTYLNVNWYEVQCPPYPIYLLLWISYDGVHSRVYALCWQGGRQRRSEGRVRRGANSPHTSVWGIGSAGSSIVHS